MTSTDPRITPDDIEIGGWIDNDGLPYRAAYVGDTVLTLPEHRDLDDEALMAEALAEARRADILAPAIEAPALRCRRQLLDDHRVRALWDAKAPNGLVTAYVGPAGVVLVHAYDDGGFDAYVPASPESPVMADTMDALRSALGI